MMVVGLMFCDPSRTDADRRVDWYFVRLGDLIWAKLSFLAKQTFGYK
jgi:hypothetical protein